MSRVLGRVVLAVGAVMCLAASAAAQQTTSTTETKKFEVIAVDGNQLVVRLPEGTREITVPEDFRFTVDGRSLSVHELKPGMKGTANITTKTTVTPVTVTEVKNGTVQQATGGSIIVRTDQGFKMFTQGDVDKRGIKIMKDGQPVQISDLHSGDSLTATIVTAKPPRVVSEKEVKATLARSGEAPPPPAASAARPAPTGGAASGAAAPAATAGATAGGGTTAPAGAKKLPKTASPLPLLGLAGVASLVTGAALTARRRRVTR